MPEPLPIAEKDVRLTHAEREALRPVLARYAQWPDAHDGPVFEAVEAIIAARLACVTSPEQKPPPPGPGATSRMVTEVVITEATPHSLTDCWCGKRHAREDFL